MQIAKNIPEFLELLSELKSKENKLGFVPTMGSLHGGHLSLVDKSLEENEGTVVSIFVNPTQFGDENDFKNYPRSDEADLEILRKRGVDLIFMPDDSEMYAKGSVTSIIPGIMADKLCGMSRNNHFKGVLTIVAKLLNLVRPDTSYFGMKDYQQFLLISKMVSDLNFQVELKLLPTVREEDGLALSSRNSRLNPKERAEASVLNAALGLGTELIREKGQVKAVSVLEKVMTHIIENSSFEVDYVSVVDPVNLDDLDEVYADRPYLIAVAADLGEVRLIDNILNIQAPKSTSPNGKL